MSASSAAIQATTLYDRISQTISKPNCSIEDMELMIEQEFMQVSPGRQMDHLTHLVHLVSFLKTKRLSNVLFALEVYADDNTSPESKKALIDALRMIPEQDNKTCDLVCYLAKKNKLSSYTTETNVSPLRFYNEKEGIDQYDTWYLLFELFSISKKAPHESIPSIADLLSRIPTSIDDIRALEQLLNIMNELDLLRPEIIEKIAPYVTNKARMEKLELVLINLRKANSLNPDALDRALSLLEHMDALNLFLSIYREELLEPASQLITLEQLEPFCQMTTPHLDNYDDRVAENSPLHLAIIERNIKNLVLSLDFATAKLLTHTSYDNTALLLACKLADKEAAKLILAKMVELGCDVNQKDSHGMTALHWAKFYRFDFLIGELISAGALEEIKTLSGKNSDYFYHHRFTMDDLQMQDRGEIIEGTFKLKEPALTDICFHMDKIALNLGFTTSDDLMSLYESNDAAQYRAANRFLLFFRAFRDKLLNWREQVNDLNHESTPAHFAIR